MKLRESRFRFVVMLLFIGICFTCFIIALLNLQIGQGAYYKKLSEKRISTTETVSAARGDVYDRNGELLITNRNGYNITLSKALFKQTEDQNQTILELLGILKEYSASPNDTLPISAKQPFTLDLSTSNNASAINNLAEKYKLEEQDITADNILEALYEEYEISESYTP